MSIRTASMLYLWIFVLALAGSSLQEVFDASHPVWIRALAGAEAAAALALLVGPVRLAGLAVLILVFSVAAFHHVADGVLPFQLVIYAASAIFVTYLMARQAREAGP